MRALFCAAHGANEFDRFFAATCAWQHFARSKCTRLRRVRRAECDPTQNATDSVAVFEDFLSLFAEVAQTQRCGRLILALLAQRHDDQNDQRDDGRGASCRAP